MKHTLRLLTVLAMLIGCGDDDTGSTDAAIDTSADATTDGMTAEDTDLPPIPDEYEFTRNGESSVAYTGQIMRHVLIADLKRHLDGISDGIDSGSYPTSAMPLVETEEGRVVAALDFYFRFDEANADVEHGFVTDPAVFETTYGDISTKNLVDKLAGNDTSTDHRDWSTAFSGWADDSIAASGGGVDSPENLIVAFFETLEANALARVDGTTRRGPGTNGTTVGDGDILP